MDYQYLISILEDATRVVAAKAKLQPSIEQESTVHIVISPDQVALLRGLVDPIFAAHVNAECEPPGFTVSVSFLGPYGSFATGHCGNDSVDLGEVLLQPEQAGWALKDEV